MLWRPLVPDAVSPRVTPGALRKLSASCRSQCLLSPLSKGTWPQHVFVLHVLDSDGFTLVQISCVWFCPFKGACVETSLGPRFLEAERAEPGRPEAQPRGSALSERASLVGVTQALFPATWPLTRSELRLRGSHGGAAAALRKGSGTYLCSGSSAASPFPALFSKAVATRLVVEGLPSPFWSAELHGSRAELSCFLLCPSSDAHAGDAERV